MWICNSRNDTICSRIDYLQKQADTLQQVANNTIGIIQRFKLNERLWREVMHSEKKWWQTPSYMNINWLSVAANMPWTVYWQTCSSPLLIMEATRCRKCQQSNIVHSSAIKVWVKKGGKHLCSKVCQILSNCQNVTVEFIQKYSHKCLIYCPMNAKRFVT